MSNRDKGGIDALAAMPEVTEETPAPVAPAAEEKRRGRPFEAGVSGNPAGRPKGSRNRRTALLEAMLDQDAQMILREIIDRALAGDRRSMEFCAQRILPRRRDRPVEFDLPEIATADDGVKGSAAILRAFSAGELSPSEARDAMALLQEHLRVLEQANLEPRVSALEEKLRE
jgi:hypothetical protein